ncbi:MAG: hypothetical protein LH632_03690 [Rhodoferax sp.]|nr:hypothetical protein [Rhodoferax sp.]
MNLSPTAPPNAAEADEDLAEQAHPGHGVPSQDPASAAQFSLEPEEAEREAKSVYVAGGMLAGAATGAAIGVAVAGPVGVVVGGSVGAVVGALGGSAAGSVVNPEDSSSAGTASTDTVQVHTKDSAGGAPPPLSKADI